MRTRKMRLRPTAKAGSPQEMARPSRTWRYETKHWHQATEVLRTQQRYRSTPPYGIMTKVFITG